MSFFSWREIFRGIFSMRFLPFAFSVLQDTGLSFHEIIDNFFYAGQLFLIIYNHQIIWDLYQKSLFKIA